MSYRLIDSNAMQLRHPEVNDMPCIYADLSNGLDGGHYDMRESDELQRENAKLRGMVAVLWECCACNTDSFWCDGCDYHDEGNGGCKVEKVLHELGIEAS